MVLMSFFAGLAATLAAVGVYAAIAFLVQRKTREIGIRLALGAAPGAVRFRVLRVGVGYGGAGVVVGGMGGWGAMKVVTAQIAGIRPLEPMLLAAAAAFVLLLAALASWIPARRATLVDPCETMRCE
jgi:ABC-type antimicrobial peptide transport system permease subunit